MHSGNEVEHFLEVVVTVYSKFYKNRFVIIATYRFIGFATQTMLVDKEVWLIRQRVRDRAHYRLA